MRLTILVIVAAAGLGALAGDAAAYPQFQLSTGSQRCQQCHFSPAGGGLLSGYGRSEAGATISRDGDGRLLHGLWEAPAWLELGADLRSALAVRSGDHPEVVAFPMQGDLYLRGKIGPVTINLTAGIRGAARAARPLVERLASREHYLMWQPKRTGPYVRAGRFFPIFGVRTQDHTAYVRRFLGFHTLEEPYGLGGGWFGRRWELHGTAYFPQVSRYLGAAPRYHGVTAYAERRLGGDATAIAGQARAEFSGDDQRYAVGAVGKHWLPGARVMLLAELDVQLQAFDAGGPSRSQLAWYLNATYVATRGVLVGATLHQWEPDLTLAGTRRDAAQLDVQYFPWAHVELHWLGRVQAQGGHLGDADALTLLQLHYYL